VPWGAIRAGTLVAGIAWCLRYLHGEFTAGIRLVAGAYLPWCGLGFITWRAWCAPEQGRALGWMPGQGTVPVALAFLTGEPFLTIMAVGFGLAVTWRTMSTARLRPMGGFGAQEVCAVRILSLALAAGIAAVVIVPAHRIAQGNARGDRLARATAEVGSLHPCVCWSWCPDPWRSYTDYVAGPWVGEPDSAIGASSTIVSSASVIALASFVFGAVGEGR